MAGARLLILDEPTSVLAPQEVDALFTAMRALRAQGLSMVIITHKLNEARAIADRVTVLRGGKVVLRNADPRDYDDAHLVEAMVGRSVPPLPAQGTTPDDQASPLVELKSVAVTGDRGESALRNVDLIVQPGELVGVAGVAGNGQRELCEVILGLRAPASGTVRIGHRAVGVPEDPITDAVVPGLTVLEHMALGDVRGAGRRLGIDWKRVRAVTVGWNERAQLHMAPLHRQVAELSGGNIQRVILTRALGGSATTIIVAAYPSRGLDVATTRRTQELLLERRGGGRCGARRVRGSRRAPGHLRPDRGAARRGDRRDRPPSRDRSLRHRPPHVERCRMSGLSVVTTVGRQAWRCAVLDASALVIFGAFVLAKGADPVRMYADVWASTFGDAAQLQTVLVRFAVLLLAGLAVAVPARAGLLNVGGEGQIVVGAVAAAGVGLATDQRLPGGLVLVLMIGAEAGARAAWAAIAGVLRLIVHVNEAITTLLLNYVAIDVLLFLIYEPWKDASGFGQPSSRPLADGARLPLLSGTTINVGLILALALLGGWCPTAGIRRNRTHILQSPHLTALIIVAVCEISRKTPAS
jgi:ABC-type Mn2+/Zn2+ transport system ATPase subunit